MRPDIHSEFLIGEQSQAESALWCLAMMTRFHGLSFDGNRVVHEFSLDRKSESVSITELILVARRVGLHAKSSNPSINRLPFVRESLIN